MLFGVLRRSEGRSKHQQQHCVLCQYRSSVRHGNRLFFVFFLLQACLTSLSLSLGWLVFFFFFFLWSCWTTLQQLSVSPPRTHARTVVPICLLLAGARLLFRSRRHIFRTCTRETRRREHFQIYLYLGGNIHGCTRDEQLAWLAAIIIIIIIMQPPAPIYLSI